MIELLSDFPEDVLAIRMSGEVTAEDYRATLVPAALKGIEIHGHLRLYCEIAPNTEFTPGAMWQDTRLGIGHWGDWGRAAVVTDIAWMKQAIHLFAPLFHHPLRSFGNSEAAQARAWVSEKG